MNPQLSRLRLVCWLRDLFETIIVYLIITMYSYNITGSELSRDIVIPVVATLMSIGVFLLLLVVIALIIFMSKQITNA